MKKILYTIGYAGFPDINAFIQALKKYGIQILIDVRSTPYSAFHSIYNKDTLSKILIEHEIHYVSFAHQFGARQENRDFYKDGRLDFSVFSKSDQFLDGVSKVEKSHGSIVFMCAEKEPSTCHRTILVARAFSDRGHEIIHILPDGTTKTQRDVEAELLDEYFPNRAQGSLFDENNLTDAEYLNEAYKLRNDEIGFKLEDLKK